MNQRTSKAASPGVPAPSAPDITTMAQTPLHRRGFFGLASAGAAALAVRAALPAAAAERARVLLSGNLLMLDQITHDVFAEYLGDTFQLELGSGKNLVVQLASATPVTGGIPGRRTPFSVLFHAPPEAVVPQKIYEISHRKLGPMQIFLVPIRKDKQGLVLEAVFN